MLDSTRFRKYLARFGTFFPNSKKTDTYLMPTYEFIIFYRIASLLGKSERNEDW